MTRKGVYPQRDWSRSKACDVIETMHRTVVTHSLCELKLSVRFDEKSQKGLSTNIKHVRYFLCDGHLFQ